MIGSMSCFLISAASGSPFVGTEQERKAYDAIQSVFCLGTFLVHFIATRRLYIDIDASKERGFGATIYHVKGDSEAADIKEHDIEPSMFLSQLLTPGEQKYWPTEMEAAGLVWVVKKIRKMVESSTRPTVVLTDHASTHKYTTMFAGTPGRGADSPTDDAIDLVSFPSRRVDICVWDDALRSAWLPSIPWAWSWGFGT